MSDTDLNRTLRAFAEEAELVREDAVSPTARRKTRRAKDPSQVYAVRIPVDRLEQRRRADRHRPTITTAAEALEVLRQVVLGQARAGSNHEE